MDAKRKKYSRKMLVYLLVAVFLVVQVYPIIWVFLASFKTNTELSVTPFSLPSILTLENYQKVIHEGKIWLYMWNSTKLTVVALVLIMVFSSTTGFALAKFREKSARKIYSFFTFGIMIPVQITLIPLFYFL